MRGLDIHKAMLSRCEALMNLDIDEGRPTDLSKELEAVAAACEAYERVMFPINWAHDPEAIIEDDEPQTGRDYA
jgi:hypothetical protein